MKKSAFLSCVFIVVFALSCTEVPLDNSGEVIFDDNYGEVEISFNYYMPGVPQKRLRRADLSFAYTADSVFREQFFLSTNVSDSINKYTVRLRPGIYYYRASVVCECGGDSCKYAGFTGQNTLRQTASKFQIIKGEKAFIHTQFQ